MNWKQKYYEELYHHGIKGQKWGRRRYQNQDGSLTPAGEKRYGGGNTDSDRSPAPLIKKSDGSVAGYSREHDAIDIKPSKGDSDRSPSLVVKKDGSVAGYDSNANHEPMDIKPNKGDSDRSPAPLIRKSDETGLVPVSKKSKNTADDAEDIGEIEVDLDDVIKPSSGKNDTSDTTSAKKTKILEADSDQYTVDDTPGQKRKDAKEAARREKQEEAEKAREAKKREKEAEKNRKQEEAEKKKNEKEGKSEKEKPDPDKDDRVYGDMDDYNKARERQAKQTEREEKREQKKNAKKELTPEEQAKRSKQIDKTLGTVKNLGGDVDKATQGLGKVVDVIERNRKQKAVRNSDAYQYTNQELDAKIARMQKEATYNEWKYTKQTSRGAEVAKNVLDTVGGIAITAGAVAGAALTIKKLLGK